MSYLFTSESVSEGHPDKIADQISDAILDNFLAFDPNSKVACETLVTTGQVILSGEVKSRTYIDVQKVAFDQMDNRRGAVVAVEIDTGSIVSYVSTPSFSTNAISNGISSSEFSALIKDKNKPFFDRASQGRYSPASTIKPAIGLFGLENNIIDWNFTIEVPGYFILPEDQRVYRGWREGGHGKVNLNKAIIVSSNTFFFSLAYQSDIYKLRIEN